MITEIAGLTFSHLPLTNERPSQTVSRATQGGETCDVQVVRLKGKIRLQVVIYARGVEIEQHTLTARQVELLHRDTVRARIVGLMIPHMAETVFAWRLDGLLIHRQAA